MLRINGFPLKDEQTNIGSMKFYFLVMIKKFSMFEIHEKKGLIMITKY